MKNLPFWMPRKKNVIWYILFTFIFLLSLDFWQWNKYNPIYFGMPMWMIYFLILSLLTSFSFYLFAKYYWSDYSD